MPKLTVGPWIAAQKLPSKDMGRNRHAFLERTKLRQEEQQVAGLPLVGMGGSCGKPAFALPYLLTWSDEATALRRRLAFLHHHLGELWPAMDDTSLLDRADEWLGPELDALARGAKASSVRLLEPPGRRRGPRREARPNRARRNYVRSGETLHGAR